MTKTPKRPKDVSQLAKMVVDIASGETEIANKTVKKSRSILAKKSATKRRSKN